MKIKQGGGGPVGGAVVAVVGQEVVIKLPENVQRDAAVGGRHVVVGLAEHGVEAVQRQELAEELVSHAVDVEKTFQFLKTSGWGKVNRRRKIQGNPDALARFKKGAYHDRGEVLALKSVNGQFQRLVQGG